MKQLALSLFALGTLSQAAGCIITTSDNDPIGGGAFEVSWTVTDGCPSGAAARIYSVPTAGQPFEDIYSCVDGIGTTATLPDGDYTVYVEITTADNSALLAQSTSQDASIFGDIVSIAMEPFPVDSAYMQASWTISDTGGNELSCNDVLAMNTSIVATSATTSDLEVSDFPCPDGIGVSNPMPLDDYTVVMELVDEQNQSVNTLDPVNAQLTYGNQLYDLGNFDFVFQAAN